jgi:hypothetical protein
MRKEDITRFSRSLSHCHCPPIDPDHRVPNSCGSSKCQRKRRNRKNQGEASSINDQKRVSTPFALEEKAQKFTRRGQNVNRRCVTKKPYPSRP